jgi:hypothetical protein
VYGYHVSKGTWEAGGVHRSSWAGLRLRARQVCGNQVERIGCSGKAVGHGKVDEEAIEFLPGRFAVVWRVGEVSVDGVESAGMTQIAEEVGQDFRGRSQEFGYVRVKKVTCDG